jgi:uncharacterized membrane protein
LGKADAIGYAVCHRIDLRSFHIGSRALPLCSRCSGIYLGTLVTLLVLQIGRGRFARFPSKKILLVLAIWAFAFGVDGVNSAMHLLPGAPHLYPASNILRLITGTGLGIGIATIVFPGFNDQAWVSQVPQQVLSSWFDLAWLTVLGALIVIAVRSENPLLLYPLALLSSLGALTLLTIVYTMLLLLIFKRENRAMRWRDLAIPLTAGMTLAFIQIGLINLLRYGLTGTWSGILP